MTNIPLKPIVHYAPKPQEKVTANYRVGPEQEGEGMNGGSFTGKTPIHHMGVESPEPYVVPETPPEHLKKVAEALTAAFSGNDPVTNPAHYTSYKGIEVIQLTEQLNLCKGNAVKYIVRAGLKDPDTEIQDLEKARWYLDREIERLRS